MSTKPIDSVTNLSAAEPQREHPQRRRAPRCFLAVPYTGIEPSLRHAVELSAREAGFKLISLDQSPIRPGTIQELVISEIARADCIIADLTGNAPNVFFEIGLAHAMGKTIFTLVRADSQNDASVDLRGYQYLTYLPTASGLLELRKSLAAGLREFRHGPKPLRAMPGARFTSPFFVDWDRIDLPDVDNLVRELLAQMGYRRIDWTTGADQMIDLIAELPKKDPDGFEYRELWFVTLRSGVVASGLIDALTMNAEHFWHDVIRDSDREKRMSRAGSDIPTTLLIVQWKADHYLDEREIRRMRQMNRRSGGLRVRVWDRNYLTSLVQQFPLIGYKYFSDEARSRSKHRKTYEELYQETVTLNNSLTDTVEALEEEKTKRITAERDAIWKDISFSAAHKIGNPIFAIDTYLDPLQTRIMDGRQNEALEIMAGIRVSVEKANAIVDEFKSLTRAQHINPTQFLLRPLLENACQAIAAQDITCTVISEPQLTIVADAERLSECFDELTRNATHWFNKKKKLITIEAKQPAPRPYPDGLDPNVQYTLIEFRDNGAGVPMEIKVKIFDAFFTRREHGTGLGLALVRRVIEGHGGVIFENGIPGSGACFQIYMPSGSRITSDEKKRTPVATETGGDGK